jgi:serine phosphatase RsbU (regulator of sigma subunit)
MPTIYAVATTQHIPIASLVEHAEALEADMQLAFALPEFARRKRQFLGVVEQGRYVGLANGSEISQALSSQFGHALFGRTPLKAHTSAQALVVAPETPLTDLLKLAAARNDGDFFMDIAVVAADRTFVGLIPMHRVVRLQTSLLLENLEDVKNKSRELADRNRQMEDDLQMAREVQLAILPDKPVCLTHAGRSLTTQHYYRSSDQIGGDFFAVLQPAPDKLGLFVCDVMGHGIRSALITSNVSALLQESQSAALDPGQLLTRLNQGLQRILHSVHDLIFVTAAYAVIDLGCNEVHYSQAGHPPAFLWRCADGSSAPVPLTPEAEGPALGLIDDTVYVTATFAFCPGDILMLFTDGVVEAASEDGTEFGMERVQKVFNQGAKAHEPDLAAYVAEAARAHAASGRFSDDVCVLVSRLQPADTSQAATLQALTASTGVRSA